MTDVKEKIPYQEAQRIVIGEIRPVGTEKVPLAACNGRVLAEDLTALEDVPAFDRSPYDGYAFRAEDIGNASPEHPVTLRIIEEIAAGDTSHIPVGPGTAVRLMTGAPLPEGADTIEKFEKTVFTENEVTFSEPVRTGSNVIRAGEDVRAGTILAQAGTVIDGALLGVLAAQNRVMPEVYHVPQVAILSTGNELVEPGSIPGPGKILNTNRYTIGAAVEDCGCHPVYQGITGDNPEKLAKAIAQALEQANALVLTGGVSVGKYDYTLEAMEQAGAVILFSGIRIKPGMACVYGVKDGKMIMGLSGNPASSLTNFHVAAAPALRKLCGQREYEYKTIRLTLWNRFPKKSPQTRFLRGILELADGKAGIRLSEDQGNVVLHSAVGSNVMAVVPAGSGPLEAGTILEGFLL